MEENFMVYMRKKTSISRALVDIKPYIKNMFMSTPCIKRK